MSNNLYELPWTSFLNEDLVWPVRSVSIPTHQEEPARGMTKKRIAKK
jgi:hypothetical protein